MPIEAIKKQLYRELKIKNEVSVEGVNVDSVIFRHLDLGGAFQEQVHLCFEMDHETHEGIQLPAGFETPGGLNIPFKWDRRSDYKIIWDGATYLLTYKEEPLFHIVFNKRPQYFDLKSSDGTPFQTIAGYSVGFVAGSAISVAYSNECALKEKGQDCLFCNINATKSTYAESEGIGWKNPRQIAEAVETAYRLDGVTHMTLTGGFIPERREVDYYLDVAESIQDVTGLNDFNGTAVIGAPADLSIIDKYKDAGFRTISINLEVWDENYFKVILPGKSQQCGGREYWLKALEYAAKVFGRGKVRTSFVTGIEPKAATLEGVEYLASRGILSLAGAWTVNPGSALEGHRTPEPAWHLDMAYQCYNIFKKYGFGYKDYFDISPFPHFLVNDLFAIEEERLPIFRSQDGQAAV